mmetsp:Transcript_118760/g.222014  ORF Transcript_118760/g.222014 Transcript_118760/m.222014 type:complete len:863 (-) Transcript_118760:18-2606(-)
MTQMHAYQCAGRGSVPPMHSLFAAAAKESVELLHSKIIPQKMMGRQLDFTLDGIAAASVLEFFDELTKASSSKEPIVETGNKYGVSAEFHKLNGDLVVEQVTNDSRFLALSESRRARALEIFTAVFQNANLRNRNPLHASVLDSCVLSNLLNFPKHIFGFPFGSYATDGNEALSLMLYSYRQRCNATNALLLYVTGPAEDELCLDWRLENLKLCCERLSMVFSTVTVENLNQWQNVSETSQLAVVMTSFENPRLGTVADWAHKHQASVHIHICDAEWRHVFQFNEEPVHFHLPEAVRSLSIEEGLLLSAYTLYRDLSVRDAHFDVGLDWDTVYMSPNEGGSGASLNLFVDFVFILCGWSALRDISINTEPSKALRLLQPTFVTKDAPRISALRNCTLEDVSTWAKQASSSSATTKEKLECTLVSFELQFLGGKKRHLEALTTGGGTRSINLAFEAVMHQARAASCHRFKVVTGNPHLAVERASRRFGFDLVRIAVDGVICLNQLQEVITDPTVLAVYAQTLSYTDGVTDPVPDIVKLVEAENKSRTGTPITLINDSCLAFSVLVHNTGEGMQQNMRILDLTEDCCNTPTIVTLDAHKHLGTDKGVSSVIGTQGTLSCLEGYVKVGAQPSKDELIRALANLWYVGQMGYYELYHNLASAVERTVESIESAGMTIVHAKNRVKGSTVFAVEDPSGLINKKLKKLGHSAAPLFGICPGDPNRCQTGFAFSLTANALREYRDEKPALDTFLSDIISVAKQVQDKGKKNFFKENSLAGHLWVGGWLDVWVFSLLRNPGLGRKFAVHIVRRYPSCMLDYGVICSRKIKDPILKLAKRILSLGVLGFTILLALLRQRSQRTKRMPRRIA